MAQSHVLTGRVTDMQSHAALSYVNIVIQGTENGTLSDQNGYFRLEVTQPKVVLEVRRLGYQTQYVRLSFTNARQQINVALAPSDVTLDNVVISDGLQRVFKDKKLHLYDYEFYEDQLFVIIYNRARRRAQLALVNDQDSIIEVTDGLEPPGKLVRDCMGNVHVLGRQYACQLFVQQGRIGMYQDSLATFERVVAPCLGSLDQYYYYKFGQGNDQVMQYLAYNAETQEPQPMLRIKDKEKIHQMLDPLGPYVQFASTEEDLLAIPAAYWEKINKIDHHYQFDRLAFFYPISAPLHVLDDQIYLFDHTNGLIHRLEKDGSPVSEVPIAYHKLPHFERAIYTDPIRGDAYAVFEKNGYFTLREIDLETGELSGSHELPRQFPGKVQVRDGVVFFLYKELNYDTTKRLYRLRIKD